MSISNVLAILAVKCFSVRVSTCRVTSRNVLSMVRVGIEGIVDVRAKSAMSINVFVSVCGAVSLRVCGVALSCIVRRIAACGPNYLVSGHCISKKH